ncbi:MAG TPA: CinA family protein [Usitatibacter sp.]|nr:CinA family protein [Usitatibacter sp.]
MTEDDITELSRKLGRAAKRRRVQIVTAESCTGGGVAAAITRISGSAKYFDRGFVTYANDAKRELLGVNARTLKRFGAVSEEVAREMATGALKKSPSDVSVSVTGIAGPTGAAPGKPVGLVWFAWAQRGGPVQSRGFRFEGGRVEVRMQSVYVAIRGLIDLLR